METAAPRFIGRVLLVEDNPINRLIAGELLEQLRVDFEVAHDGVEALEKLATTRFALVLMDCLMPRLDGFAAAQRWRERELAEALPRTPIVAVTANATVDDRARCIASGMDDMLGKPLQLQALASLVARYVRAA